MDSIETSIKSGERLDSGRLYTFTRILPLIAKIKDYEDALKKATMKKDKVKNTLTEEELREIEELLGLRHYPKPNEQGE